MNSAKSVWLGHLYVLGVSLSQLEAWTLMEELSGEGKSKKSFKNPAAECCIIINRFQKMIPQDDSDSPVG